MDVDTVLTRRPSDANAWMELEPITGGEEASAVARDKANYGFAETGLAAATATAISIAPRPKAPIILDLRGRELDEVIEECFSELSCSTFIALAVKPSVCQCGRDQKAHPKSAFRDSKPGATSRRPDQQWAADRHTDKMPTRTFGTLNFPATQTSAAHKILPAYMRVSVFDDEKQAAIVVKEIFKRRILGYADPKLIISVTGSAKSMVPLPQRLLEMFKDGLTKAIHKTNAWVTSGGTNCGVMQLVGEMLAEAAHERMLPVVGIPAWAAIGGKETLMGKRLESSTDGGEALIDQTYNYISYNALDPNHNLFLLVDDGREGLFGGEIEWRAKFEKAVSLADPERPVPVVCVLIQGGRNSVTTAFRSIQKGQTLVVVHGTGGAADLIAYAWEFKYSASASARNHSSEELRTMCRRMFESNAPTKDIDLLMSEVLRVVVDEQVVHIFDYSSGDKSSFEDVLMRAVFSKQLGNFDQQLDHAMIWNRPDEGKKSLQRFRDYLHDDSDKDSTESFAYKKVLGQHLFKALKSNNHRFVKLFLEAGAQCSKLVPETPDVFSVENYKHKPHGMGGFYAAVEELYAEPIANVRGHVHAILKGFKSTKEPSRKGVARLKRVPLEWIEAKLAFCVSPEFKLNHEIVENVSENNINRDLENHAFKMLMIWALCLNQGDLAALFWVRTKHTVINALVGSALLQGMCRQDAMQKIHLSDEREELLKSGTRFEQLAIGVLDQCHDTDQERTIRMLKLSAPQFDDTTALGIAYLAHNYDFLSRPAVQTSMSLSWYGKLSPATTAFSIILGAFFPLYIFALSFTYDSDDYVNPEEAVLCDVSSANRNPFKTARPHTARKSYSAVWFKKIVAFYNAPVTRFWMDCVFYMGLLLLFTYMVLTPFTDVFSVSEIIVLAWFCAMAVDEIRQVYHYDGLRLYFKVIWNRLDVILLACYMIGVGLRLADLSELKRQNDAKIAFSMTACPLFFRLARYYATSPKLGPKLIMMHRMMDDLFTFCLLVVLFLLGYGVATSGILYADKTFDRYTAVGIVYRPYFAVFSNDFLESFHEESTCIGDFPFSNCGDKAGYLLPFLAGSYLLITNILLINLLIAMFNETYKLISGKSRHHWNRQNYELKQEYEWKPLFPGPLMLVSHFLMLLQVCFSCLKAKFAGHSHSSKFDHVMAAFTSQATDRYLVKRRKELADSEPQLIIDSANELKKLSLVVREAQDQNGIIRVQLDRQELKIKSLINKFLPDDERHRAEAQQAEIKATSLPIKWRPAAGTKYPGTSIIIPDVPAACLLWESAWVDLYKAREITTERVLTDRLADPQDPSRLAAQFNKTTQHRESVYGPYRIDEASGRPLNPVGRTGITGRGALYRWGVNKAVETIVTRWKRSANGVQIERDGKPVLEVVLAHRTSLASNDDDAWSLPKAFVRSDEDLVQTALRSTFRSKAISGRARPEEDHEIIQQALQELASSFRNIAYEYSEDERNTDNAWVESFVIEFHDPDGLGVGKLDLLKLDKEREGVQYKARWMMVHKNMQLSRQQKAFLDEVRLKHGAHW